MSKDQVIVDEHDARVFAVNILAESDLWWQPYAYFQVTEYDYDAGLVYIKGSGGREFELQVVITEVQ